MTVELEEFSELRDNSKARLGTLEAASDRHTVEIGLQRGQIVSTDEDLTKIQVEFRAQRAMLQALHDTQNEHISTLREHTSALAELKTGQADLRRGVTEVSVGIRTIIGLLDPDRNEEHEPS